MQCPEDRAPMVQVSTGWNNLWRCPECGLKQYVWMEWDS
jgi:hypothetical protein